MALLLGNGESRSMLIALLVAIWAVRLGTFLFRRVTADGHDRRFDAIKQSFSTFFMTWTLQGLWVSLTLACGLAALTATVATLAATVTALTAATTAAATRVLATFEIPTRAISLSRSCANQLFIGFLAHDLWLVNISGLAFMVADEAVQVID